ncbi:TfoX/Sxy family DNA transformation protein [Xanthovirga aplysinae]|uniref:TfoX/Sxy family DNA transformation protein n=1 Tax=Xanthovirga aplysinae TaxID=2529853 RepID=UPI00165754C0|nr:competence protein TfoX [Xanthovirga aplysinae]
MIKAKNIGKTIAKRLNEIEVFTLADLAEMTPKVAYQKIREKYPDKIIPKCYYLYSLQGALMNLDWRELPKEIKAGLID